MTWSSVHSGSSMGKECWSEGPGRPFPKPHTMTPRAQAPSPSSLRPRGLGPQPLLPQTQGSRPPAPPPSDPGVQAPSPSSLRLRSSELLRNVWGKHFSHAPSTSSEPGFERGQSFPKNPPSQPTKMGIYPQFTEQETEVPRARSPYTGWRAGGVGRTWARLTQGPEVGLAQLSPLLQPAINKDSSSRH